MTPARAIVHQLRGRWHGSYGSAFCPAHKNTRTEALSVRDGPHGELLVKCFSGCSRRAILDALGNSQVAWASSTRSAAPRTSTQPDAKNSVAKRIWDGTVDAPGTSTEAYLRRRAISGPIPAAIRHHHSAWHGIAKRSYSAMVVPITVAGKFVGIQRTFLRDDGQKAEVQPVRMMLGGARGGCVMLQYGHDLVVAEGVETALALREILDLNCATAASLGTGGMDNMQLPQQPGRLVIAADGDDPGRAAAGRLQRRAATAGWEVEVIQAPDGEDWNDVLMRTNADGGSS